MNIELKSIIESKLTPNEYVVLLHFRNGIKDQLWFEYESILEQLKSKKYLNDDESVTSKTLKLFDADVLDISYHENKTLEDKALTLSTLKFIQIFPPIILPSGVHARGGMTTVKTRLKSFISTFGFDWDIIYQAANNYVNRYEQQNYKYMKNCPNFIFNKDGESTLALECDTVENNWKIQSNR